MKQKWLRRGILGVLIFGLCCLVLDCGVREDGSPSLMPQQCKDFFCCLLKPDPTFLGDAIPVSGNGDLSNG